MFFYALRYFGLQGKEIEAQEIPVMEVTADPPITELTMEDSPLMYGIIDSDADKHKDNVSVDVNISTPPRESPESQVCIGISLSFNGIF